MSTCFPQALQFSNQSRMSIFNHVVENQPDKLQSPQPPKHLAHQGCVPQCLKSSDGPLISLLRQDYSQAFLQRPSRPSVLSSLWSLPFLLTDAKLPSPSSSPISLSSCTSLLGPPLASVTHLIELPSLLSRDMHMTPLWLDCELTEDKRYLSWLILGPAQLEAPSLWLSVDLCSYQSLNPNSDIGSSHHTHHRGSLMCFPYSRTLLPKIHTHMSTYVHTCISMCVCICACIYTFSATCWLSKSRSCV